MLSFALDNRKQTRKSNSNSVDVPIPSFLRFSEKALLRVPFSERLYDFISILSSFYHTEQSICPTILSSALYPFPPSYGMMRKTVYTLEQRRMS